MTTIQSSNMPIELSFDSGLTWLTLVCLTDYSVPVETPTNVTETFCGIAVGTGTTSFNPTGNAVCEVVPTSSQVTYKHLLNAQVNGIEIMFRVRYLTSGGSIGNTIYLSGTCLVTNTELQASNNEVVKFSWTLTGTGTLDTTP